jgi:hypothetical protein
MQPKLVFLAYLMNGISALLLMAGSCREDDGPMIRVDLAYANRTSHRISIEHFARENNQINSRVPQTIMIEPGDTASFYSSQFESTKDADAADFNDFIVKNRLYDSAYLVFDNERYIGFSKGKLNQDIFSVMNFQGGEVKNNEFIFVYEFSEDDYDRAAEVGG